MLPPRRPGRWTVWLLLLVCLAVPLPGMLFELAKPQVTDAREAAVLVTSIQSWRQWTGQPHDARAWLDWFEPYRNGHRDLTQPPMVTWLHLLAFAALDPDTATLGQLVARARMVSVIFGLVCIGGVYWAGFSLGDRRTAGLAALLTAAMPLMLYFSRLATPDIVHVGWVSLAVAAALWAVRPLRPMPSVERQFIGWMVMGAATAGAVLTAGPWAMGHVLLPAILIILLVPNRTGHFMGLIAALLIGVLLVLPWNVFAAMADPTVVDAWAAQMLPADWTRMDQLGVQIWQRVVRIMAASLPWTLWLVVGLLQFFSASSGGLRLRITLGWVWLFAGITLVALAPREGFWADQLVVLPAGAVVLAMLFSQYADLAAEGRFPRFWRLFRWPYVAAVLLGGAAIPLMLYFHDELQARGWWGQQLVTQVSWWYALGLAAVLLAIGWLSARWSRRHYPGKAMTAWAMWVIVAMSLLVLPVARGPWAVYPDQAPARVLGGFAADRTMYWLAHRPDDAQPPARMQLYADRAMPVISPATLPALLEESTGCLLLTDEPLAGPDPSLVRVPGPWPDGLLLYQHKPAVHHRDDLTGD